MSNRWCNIAFLFSIFSSVSPQFAANQAPNSPCPNILQYSNNGRIWFGIIKFPISKYGSQILLEVKMSLNAELDSEYVGRIEMVGSQQEILQTIYNRDMLTYRVYFPLKTPLPIFTSISVNKQQICQGPQVSNDYLTMITLEHRFNGGTNIPMSNDFEENKISNSNNNNNIDNNYSNNNNMNNYNSNDNNYNNNNNNNNNYNNNNKNNNNYNNNNNNQFSTTRPFQSNRRPITTTTQQYTPVQMTTERIQYQPISPQRPSTNEECGVAPAKATNALILGGEETNPGDWPWLAAMFHKKPVGLDFICSGSIISNSHIITAAHCVYQKYKGPTPPESLVVKVGAYNIQDWADPNAKIANVRQVYTHPMYNSTNLQNDIAILQLDQIMFNDLIKPVCIWNQRPDQNIVVGKIGTVIGWGRDENGNLVTPTPRENKMPIVSLETCRASNPDFFLFTSYSTLCAGKRDGTGPCNGDSGGGLFLYDNGRWTIRGIVSNSLVDRKSTNLEPCTLKDYVIFTDAAQFTTWVRQTISIRN